MTDSTAVVPKLGGRDAAYVMRMLSIARARDLPLAPAMAAAADIEGLRQARGFARFVAEMDDDEFVDALVAALERGDQRTGAHVVETLRPAGLPADGLRRLADWYTERAAARHRIFTAISYPFTLTIVGGLVYGVVMHLFLMPWIIRSFDELFYGLGATPPPLTRFVLWIYGHITSWMSQPVSATLYIVAVVLAASAAVWFTLRFQEYEISLKIPLARRFLYQEAGASFCSALALLLEHDVDAPSAVRLAARVPANRSLGARLAKMADNVESGANMGECLRTERALLPAVRWQLWSAYYRSDLIDELKATGARSREQLRATELRIVNSSRILVGAVATVVFFPIGVVVVAMYLPMFSLVSQIG